MIQAFTAIRTRFAGFSTNLWVALGATVVVAVMGLLFLTTSASSFFVAVEADQGTTSGNATLVSDSSASGGRAVRFTAPNTPPSGGGGAGGVTSLSLPLIPWEGGPAYWAQFPKTAAGGWTNPAFFPIVIDNSFSQESEVQFDKAHGITTYSGGYPDYVDYSWLKNNGMYWLDVRPNNTFPSLTASADQSANWPGLFVADEPDGAHGSAQADMDYMQSVLNSNPENGRFREINFTQIVAGDYGSSNNAIYTQMVNSYRGPISADMYWYTTSNCGPGNPGYDFMLYAPVDTAHCRTSSSYGNLIKSLRQRDAADGVLKPTWQYVEDLNGGPGEGPFYANITPGQLKGAVMDSIINEARGIIYFNTSLTGPCSLSVVLRSVQSDPNGCAKTQVAAMQQVNLQIQNLAPIINTQSYQYSFGNNLDTMLKWYNGSAYVFAMINGAAGSSAGNRTFTLPSQLAGVSSVQVVDENRTVSVSGGKFTDNFAAEYSYHIYQITP